MGLVVLLSAVAGALLLCHLVLGALRRARIAKQMEWIPGPKSYPLIGSGYYFMNKQPDGIFKEIIKLTENYRNGIFKMWIGPEPTVVVFEPKLVQAILSQNQELRKSHDYGHVKAFIGDGLLISTGQKWHHRRKLLTPAFHYDILENFVPTMQKQAFKFVNHIRPLAEKREKFDIVPYAKRLALDVLMDTAVGDNVNALEDPQSEYNKAIKKMGEIILLRGFSLFYSNPWLYNWSSVKRAQERAKQILEDFTYKIIVKRDEERKTFKETVDEVDDGIGKKKRLALLDLLLEMKHSGADLNHSDISEEVNTFLFAGHDTTSSCLAFTLYLLGKHRKIQEDVVKEINDLIPDIMTRPLKQQDLNKLDLLDRCIKESLRLYPPAALIGRQFDAPFKVNDKQFIPAGMRVSVNMFALHRSPEYFPDPETFNPDRFLKNSNENILLYSYIPFSAGPRNCIGQRYALYELKVLLSVILSKYEVEAYQDEEDLHLAPAIILIPMKEMLLSFKPRAAA